jgi:sulfonate transport system substrate-binding protein
MMLFPKAWARVPLAFAAALLLPAVAAAQEKLTEIKIDWATYNPVSIVLKNQGLLEKEFEKDGVRIQWVQSLGSNKALEFLNASSLDFGSTAGAAALVGKINGNPIKSIYVYSRPEWATLVTRPDTGIKTVADLKGKRVAATRGTDPHIFLIRALQEAGLSEKDITLVLLQHGDGKAALIRGRARPDHRLGGDRGRRRPLPPQQGGQHVGYPQRARGVREGASRRHQARARRL